METAVPGLSLGVLTAPTTPAMVTCEPQICVVLQGRKQVLVGGRVLHYDSQTFFASAVELLATGYVLEADGERPYIAAGLTLDVETLTSLFAESPDLFGREQGEAFGVAPVSADLLVAFDGMLALLDATDDIPMLLDGKRRELHYRLLQSQLGPMMRRIVRHDGRLSQVRRAIAWMHEGLDRPTDIKALADLVGMSPPTFHRHFKAATALSPLQYHKRLRLHAARRMLINNGSVTETALAVGYQSISQFSREYSRLYGRPPSQDIS